MLVLHAVAEITLNYIHCYRSQWRADLFFHAKPNNASVCRCVTLHFSLRGSHEEGWRIPPFKGSCQPMLKYLACKRGCEKQPSKS